MRCGSLAGLVASLGLGACVAGPPLGPTVVVMPGKDTNQAVFQRDEAVCQRQAAARTGFGDTSKITAATPLGSGSEVTSVAIPAATGPVVSYLQCMAAHGNVVQMASMMDVGYYTYAYPYGGGYPYSGAYPFSYLYGYPYGYGGGYPFAYNGFIGGWGGWYGGRWRHEGWGHGGWGRGGGFHGGWGHGGWCHGGGFRGGGRGHR